MSRPEGFAPIFDGSSRLLILGSFPSVKSRAVGFYYGNPQNRFWGMLSSFFGEEIPPDPEGKRAFLLEKHIALWDMVTSCEIEGSSDASIRAESVADIRFLFGHAPIECVLCNGAKSYSLLAERYPQYLPVAQKLPSTSSANPRYEASAWHAALARVFEGDFPQKP